VTNSFLTTVKKELAPGKSALLICGVFQQQHRKGVVEKLRQWNPKVLESDLPEELEKEVNDALQRQQQASV
jgi:uncharacterized membrane protein